MQAYRPADDIRTDENSSIGMELVACRVGEGFDFLRSKKRNRNPPYKHKRNH